MATLAGPFRHRKRSGNPPVSEKRLENSHIVWGKPGNRGDIGAGFDFSAVSGKIFHEVAAISKRVHDVVEIAGVLHSDGMADFVNAGKIHNGVAQQAVT